MIHSKKIINFFLIAGFVFAFTGLSIINTDNSNLSSNDNISPDKKLPVRLIKEKKIPTNLKSVTLFNFESTVTENDNSATFVSSGRILNLQKQSLKELLMVKTETILFNIPVSENNFLELELSQSLPLSNDFVLISKNGISEKQEYFKEGLHYNGIVSGDERSIASISIFENFIMGIISDETGNYVLGSIKNSDNTYSSKYIFYNDKDLIAQNSFKCDVDKYEDKLAKSIYAATKNSGEFKLTDNSSALPVKVYFEADYRMYQDFNNNAQEAANFISGMFNSVKTIYQNENIPFVISNIGIWTVPDPYINFNDSYPILLNFGVRTGDNFQGNIAHLLSSRTSGLGGIAWLRVLCSEFNEQDSSGRYAFSNIETNYNNYPTYSWAVNVVTHEMGHSLGSRHTHSCVWPAGPQGAIRAIDSCYFAEGNCFQQPRPRIGTIMSYCHLWTQQQGGGVNLSFGFGQLPGDTIRTGYQQAVCLRQGLNSSEVPLSFDLAQNFPNPFNPSTTIGFALPKESVITLKIYDVTGKLIANLIQDIFYNPGFYDFQFNASQYSLSSGIYFYTLETADFNEVRRMILLK